MADKKPAPAKPVNKKPKSAKPGVKWEDLIMNFSMDKVKQMTEQQMTIAAVVVIAVVVIVYNFVFAAPEYIATDAPMVLAPLSKPETAEERFRRENKNVVSLPDGSKVPAEVLNEKTRLIREVPFGDKMMEYMVRLPKDWGMSNFARYGLPGEETYTIMTNIARYYGPAIEDVLPFFWLEVQKLNRFVTAESYVRGYMLKNGITPEALVVSSEKQAEALYVDTRDGRSYAIRTNYHLEGPYIVKASVGVPVASYSDYKDMMGLIMRSFQLVKPIPGQIEEILERKLLNVVRFKYYASWNPKNELVQTALHPSIEMHNPQEVKNKDGKLLQGVILIDAWRTTTNLDPKAPLNDIKARLDELRMELLEEPVQPEVKWQLRDEFISITENRYHALIKRPVSMDEFGVVKSEETKTRQEVWITVMDNGYYKAYLTLITPLEDTNYRVWAQNRAAYDLLIKTLQLRPAPKEEY